MQGVFILIMENFNWLRYKLYEYKVAVTCTLHVGVICLNMHRTENVIVINKQFISAQFQVNSKISMKSNLNAIVVIKMIT